MNRSSHPRSGAALIIALLILAGLMLLGLPFLFSQSSSLSGARSFQAAQAARIYSETARNLGAALAAYTVTQHWAKDGRQLYTAIDQYLNTTMPLALGGVPPPNPPTNHTDIDTNALGFNQGGTRVRIGLAIEDESGKLDANTLGPQGWSDLLSAVGIPDWDDDSVVLTTDWPINTGPDDDQCGELANALVYQRLYRTTYAHLEDLLDVDPQNPNHTNHGAIGGISTRFRKRLSRAELERLRPYLSFHNVAAGRRGLIDLGTVIYTDDPGQLTGPNTSSFIPQHAWIDATDVQINDGTWLETQTNPTSPTIPAVARRYSGSINSWNITYSSGTPPQPGSGVFIQAPPPLNLHALPRLLRELPAYVSAASPKDVPLRPFNTVAPLIAWYGQQVTPPTIPPTNVLPLDYLRPTYTPTDLIALPPHFQPGSLARGTTERQPLDIRSGGAVTIEHAATVVDPAGNPIAQESRRTIVQAVPQEGILERHWETQGQLQPMIDQRYGSKMVTWPMATARNLDVQVDDFDPADLTKMPKAETGLSFTTNSTLASTVIGLRPTHLNVTDLKAWRVNLGNGAATTELLVFKDSQNQNPVTDGSLIPPLPGQDPVNKTGLYPDGVRLGDDSTSTPKSTRLAYPFGSNNTGPLAWSQGPAVPPATGPAADSSMGLRTISVWFRPEADWPTNSPVTILEARPLPSTVTNMVFAGVDPVDVPHSTDNTNFFGVIYDPLQNMLVLAYGTPGASFAPAAAPASLLPNVGLDLTTTAGVDERCMVGPNFLIPTRMNVIKCAAWSSTFMPNRILTCYKLGNNPDGSRNIPEIGRWYHLQVTLANGRPGGLGLILDGIAGTDVGLMTSSAYLAARQPKGPWPGDHLTLPGLILNESLIALDRTLPSPVLYVPTIKVAMPGFSAFNTDNYSSAPAPYLTPLDIMPRRGSVLIGDEYIRYQDLVQTGTTWQLMNCIRGDRQNTSTYSGDPLQHNPITEDHAIGNRVIPDGCRLKPTGTGDLYLGSATTVDPAGFINGTYNAATNPGSMITAIIQAPTGLVPLPVDTTTFTMDAGFNKAPAHGYCRIQESNGNRFYAFFTRTGNQLTLTKSFLHPTLGSCADFIAKWPDGSYSADPVNDPKLKGQDTVLNDDSAGQPKAIVTLVSLEVLPGAVSPMTLDAFQRPYGEPDHFITNPHSRPMFQIMDPVTGRCEWIRYTDIVQHPTGIYFVDRNAWNFDAAEPNNRSRAQERTPYVADVAFPLGSLILPVQTGALSDASRGKSNLGSYCKLLSPGDLITFVPTDYTRNPLVTAVRYAANDGYGTGAQLLDHNNDSVNGYFALTVALPPGMSRNSTDWEIVMGSGLNTQMDLSPTGSTSFPPSAPPLLSAHQDPTDPTKTGRLVFGGADTARGGGATAGLLMTIDAPMAAPPFGSTYASFLRRVIQGSACVDRIPASNGLPISIEVDFHDSLFAGERMGLIEIGGEIFAYRRPTRADQQQIIAAIAARRGQWPGIHAPPAQSATGPGTDPESVAQSDPAWENFATLVGRGLLGSSQRVHLLDMSIPDAGLSLDVRNSRENLDRGPEVMRLPLGPVRTLPDPLPASSTTWFKVAVDGATGSTDDFVAPAVLIVDPLGDETQTEAIQLAAIDRRQKIGQWNGPIGGWTNNNFQKWVTAPWLHGLYNTPTHDWAPSGGLQPIVIGWWTRYPSALPSKSSPQLAGTDSAAQLRSRAFPWVGFCSNLARSRFDDATMPFFINFDSSLKTNTVLNDGDMIVELRAMTGAIDGDPKVTGAFADPAGSSLGDWNARTALTMLLASGPQTGLFTWNQPLKPNETDGVEVRLSFRYKTDASSALSDIARAANRAPLIGGAKLRFHAPLTVLATESAR